MKISGAFLVVFFSSAVAFAVLFSFVEKLGDLSTMHLVIAMILGGLSASLWRVEKRLDAQERNDHESPENQSATSGKPAADSAVQPYKK
jgi:hypothetical protein